MRELITTTNKAVIFLNSKMEIIRVNEFASKTYFLDSSVEIKFSKFSQINRLDNTYQYATDINSKLQDELNRKFHFGYQTDGIPTVWRVEYFPELFDTDFKLGLIQITYDSVQSSDKIFSHAVYESVNSIVQNKANDENLDFILHNIINSLPGRAHLKLGSDYSYHITNAATLKLLGMENAQQLIGKDDYAVAKHMGSHWPAKLAQEIQELDYQIIHNQQPLIGKEETPYLDASGNLVIHSLTKLPIYNLDNKPYGILTLAVDMTHIKDVMFVRQAYTRLFKKPKDAHLYFIKHIGLNKIHVDQNDLITIRELDCLVHFTRGLTAKEVAKQMDISYRTVETHFENIKMKFNCLTRSEVISLFLAHCHL